MTSTPEEQSTPSATDETGTTPSPVVPTPPAGAAPEGDPKPEETDTDGGTDEDKLGDAGKRALQKLRAEKKAALAEAKAAREELEDAKAKTEAEKRERQVQREALAKANSRIVSAELRAAATGKLEDPEDALAFLNVEEFDVSDDGAVDKTAIDGAIEELLERKPHLAARGGTKGASMRPDASQGSQGAGRSPAANAGDGLTQALQNIAGGPSRRL